jgi:hypothetical protein
MAVRLIGLLSGVSMPIDLDILTKLIFQVRPKYDYQIPLRTNKNLIAIRISTDQMEIIAECPEEETVFSNRNIVSNKAGALALAFYQVSTR